MSDRLSESLLSDLLKFDALVLSQERQLKLKLGESKIFSTYLGGLPLDQWFDNILALCKH